MSEDKQATPTITGDETATTPVPPAPKLALAEVDKLTLDLAREQKKTALAEAKAALANNEKAELAFKNIVLRLYLKYHLTTSDAISEDGQIVKDGAIKPPRQGK